MGANTTEGATTRSRKNSVPGPGQKRKRSLERNSTDTNAPSSKKMTGGNGNPADDPSSSGPMTYGQFTHYLSTTHRGEVKKDIEAAVDKVSTRLDATNAELAAHKAKTSEDIDQIRAAISRISNQESTVPGGSYAAAAAAGSKSGNVSNRALDLLSQETRQYWQFCKCAKIHPIDGETDKELWHGLQEFIRSKLRIPTSEIAENDVVSVRRMRMGRNRGPVGEVIVVFSDVDVRDRVCSYARNLAPFVDSSNKPTAGVRMYVPTLLGGAHKALLQYGHSMRQKLSLIHI